MTMHWSPAATPLLQIIIDISDMKWADRGLCQETDPEVFFPEKGESTAAAKRVCMACEVRVSCLEYALEHHERFGVWGGLLPRQRRTRD